VDFVSGGKLLFIDDFSNNVWGAFQGKWNTNGTREVVSFNDDSGKWCGVHSTTIYGYNFIN